MKLNKKFRSETIEKCPRPYCDSRLQLRITEEDDYNVGWYYLKCPECGYMSSRFNLNNGR